MSKNDKNKLWLMIVKQCKTRIFYIKIIRKYGWFVSEKRVLFFEKSEVIFTKWCFIFVVFFDKSDYDHCFTQTWKSVIVATYNCWCIALWLHSNGQKYAFEFHLFCQLNWGKLGIVIETHLLIHVNITIRVILCLLGVSLSINQICKIN